MAAFATTAWARKAKLATAGKDWEIRFQLLANGKRPTGAVTSLRSTSFWMLIARDLYWVDFQHLGKQDSIAVGRDGTVERHWNQLGIRTPELATFAAWFADMEATIGKPFLRNRMWVQSNIKGGRDAVVGWIENGFEWS
jgi:hypothetical protein